MTLQRIKRPVFFSLFVSMQQVNVAKVNKLSTNYPTKTRHPGSIYQLSHPFINHIVFIYSLIYCINYQNTIKHRLNIFPFYSTAETL